MNTQAPGTKRPFPLEIVTINGRAYVVRRFCRCVSEEDHERTFRSSLGQDGRVARFGVLNTCPTMVEGSLETFLARKGATA